MGVIVELAHARKRIAELEGSKAALEAKVKELETATLEFYETQQPTSNRQVSFTELYQLLKYYFPQAVINLGEKHRFLCSYDDIAVFLAQDQTNKIGYVVDEAGISSYDCNVFANRLLGQFSVPGWADLTFGKVWLTTPAHALNCMVAEDKECWYIEPQTDELLERTKYSADAVRFIEM